MQTLFLLILLNNYYNTTNTTIIYDILANETRRLLFITTIGRLECKCGMRRLRRPRAGRHLDEGFEIHFERIHL